MKQIFTAGGKLFLICAVAALTLAGVNAVTEPVIRERGEADLKQTLSALSPEAAGASVVPVAEEGIVRAYYPLTGSGRFILELVGSGYGGDMKILALLEGDGTILDVRLMDNLETPGLGKKAELPAYMLKFKDSGGPERPVPVRKDMLPAAEADAITGATITFVGIAKALERGSEFTREVSDVQ
jgi:electron transport complex protein RnfG